MTDNKYNNFLQHDEKTGIYSSKGGYASGLEQCTLQLDFKPIMYFEVTFVSLQDVAAIGFAPSKPNWKVQQHIGKSDSSIGYFNDGKVFDDFLNSYASIGSFTTNDTVGAYWNTISNED